jgi:hypothetical protein
MLFSEKFLANVPKRNMIDKNVPRFFFEALVGENCDDTQMVQNGCFGVSNSRMGGLFHCGIHLHGTSGRSLAAACPNRSGQFLGRFVATLFRRRAKKHACLVTAFGDAIAA